MNQSAYHLQQKQSQQKTILMQDQKYQHKMINNSEIQMLKAGDGNNSSNNDLLLGYSKVHHNPHQQLTEYVQSPSTQNSQNSQSQQHIYQNHNNNIHGLRQQQYLQEESEPHGQEEMIYPPMQLRRTNSQSSSGGLSSKFDQTNFGTSEAGRAVNTLYSGMKQLENKYIDLANFYKDQLISEQDLNKKLLVSNQAQVMKLEYERGQNVKKQETTIQENAIIRNLITVKGDLEQQMQELRFVVSEQQYQQQTSSLPVLEKLKFNDPPNETVSQPATKNNKATHEFLQFTLQETLQELDKAQVNSLQMLSTKQYDMFDLATKHNLPTPLRNDYLGHWHEAKTSVSQQFADLKTALTLRKQMAQVQFELQQNGATPESQKQSLSNIPLKPDSQRQQQQQQLSAMTAEFTRYRQIAEHQAKKLKQIIMALKLKDQLFKEEHRKAEILLGNLSNSIYSQLQIQDGRKSRSVSPIGGDGIAQRKTVVMSPFEKRLIIQQQKSQQRSTPTRSRSIGKKLSRDSNDRGHNSTNHVLRTKSPNVGFFNDYNSLGPAGDLKVISKKLEIYLTAQEASSIACRQRDRFEHELLKQMHAHLGEQIMYIGQGNLILETQIERQKQNALDELRELVNQEKETFVLQGMTTTSPDANQIYNNQNLSAASIYNNKFGQQEQQVKKQQKGQAFENQVEQETPDLEINQNQSMAQVKAIRSQKVQDLQQSNAQLFSELRKANEKYLDVRVENNKLKDQISNLKLAVEKLKSKEKLQGRQRNYSSLESGTYTASKANSQQADAELRKSNDILKTEAQLVCNMVKNFMQSMRALQKAVSKKQSDVSQQKRSFDSSKRELEEIVELTLNKLKNLVPVQQQSLKDSEKQKCVSTLRGQKSAQSFTQGREATNFGQNSLMRPLSVHSGHFGSKPGSVTSKNQRGDENEFNLNQLQKQVNTMSMEKDKMRELIEELKQTNLLYSNERDIIEDKLKTKTSQLLKFASQCQINSQKVQMLEQILADYKCTVIDLSSNIQVQEIYANQGAQSILQIKDDLQGKEDQLKVKLQEDVNRIFVNLKIDPQFQSLREELTSQVQLKEKLLDQQFENLTFRVAEKEEDLNRLKLVFVEKLRELESSFVEISNEVVETDKVTQDVTAKRKQELKTLLDAQPMNSQDKSNNLDFSVESILSNYDNDERLRQTEELIQANHDLMDQNEKLKKEVAAIEIQAQADSLSSSPTDEQNLKQKAATDSLHAEMVIELNEQVDEVKQERDKLKMSLRLITAQESLQKKEIQGLKYDNKRMGMDLTDSKDRFEKNKQDFQEQFNQLKQTTVVMKAQLQKEYDLRTTNETKYLTAQKQLKIARTENQEQQTEMLILMKRLDDLQSEQTYLKQLLDSSESSGNDEMDQNQDIYNQPESSKQSIRRELRQKQEAEDVKEMEDRISEDPAEATRFYHKILKATKKEFKSINRQHSKLQEQKLASLELDLSAVPEKQDQAEEQKQVSAKETQTVEEQADVVESLKNENSKSSREEFRQLITVELEENFQMKQQELIQTYKRAQRDTNEKHQAALLALETQLAADKSCLNLKAQENIAEVRAQIQADYEATISKIERNNTQKVQKAQKTTKLMVCLQNRVLEMINAKLDQAMVTIQQKETDYSSLKEDLQDVTESHNLKVIALRESFEQEKKDETSQIIQKYQNEMREFEQKLLNEAQESKSRENQDQINEIISKLEKEKAIEVQQKENLLLASQNEHKIALAKEQKATRIMISMQNFVRDMLKDRLEKREKELQLEIVKISDKSANISEQLKDSQDQFERYRQDKTKEYDEMSSYKDDSAKKSGQIDAVEAQIQSMRSVQEALEREKDDLLIQNEHMEDELHRIKTELLEVKGSAEVKEMRIEELQEQIDDMCQQNENVGHNKTNELEHLGSSGKIIHQISLLNSNGIDSDGIENMMEAANNSFMTNEEFKSNPSNGPVELSYTMLQQDNVNLQAQVEKLRQDLDANIGTAGGRNSLEGSIGRGSWGSDQMRTGNSAVEDQLKHIRSIMTQFLVKLPVQAKDNEDILNIVFSMLNFPPVDIEQIKQQRAQLSNQPVKKGGFFGGKKNNKK